MAKDKEPIKEDISEMLSKTKLIKIEVEDEMKKSFISYAMAVNISRAIPDVRDGLKPVHRRIIYAMSELGLSSDKPYRKCARIVGDVLGKYHPHGDSAVYEALVRMAQDFTMCCPLVDGHGNFGSVDGDPPAAQRYTEARMSKIASELIRDIDKKTIDYYPNFDDTLEQPVVLPARYPNLLVNGSDGIAVGMATSIPPHNLCEVIDATCLMLDNPDIDIEELLDVIVAPDYPTGGLIMGRGGAKKAYRTGRGSTIIRSKTEITEGKNGKSKIVVTEIPYQVNKAKLIEAIAEQVKQKKIEGISDIHEESDREGMRIVIDVKKDSNPQVVLNMLFKHTNMQISNSMIMLALVNGTPKICNLREMLEYYIAHQKDVIVRRTQYDLEKALEKEHLLKGLSIAFANIDEVIALIKASKEKSVALYGLMDRFLLSERQANAILEMKLQRLTALEIEKIEEQLRQIELEIVEYRDILSSPQRVIDIIKTEMCEIKDKYGRPRKSEISYDYNDIDIEDLIDQEDVVLSMTHGGYIKRMATTEYKAQRRGGVGVNAHKTKEDDFVEKVLMTNTHEPILFLTNLGKVYRIKAYMVPEATKTSKGRAIVNLLNLAPNEVVTAVLPLAKDSQGYLMLVTRNGLVKKTDLAEYESIMKNGKIAIKLLEGDSLISAIHSNGDDEVLIASSGGMCMRIREEHIRDMGRTARGVKTMTLANDEYIVGAALVKDGAEVLTITENGYGKRCDIDEYRLLMGRRGKGIKAGNITEKTGKIVNMSLVTAEEDVMIVTDNGVVIRIHGDSISKISRNTQGVKVMRMKDDITKVVAFTVVPRAEDEEEDVIEVAELVVDNTADVVELLEDTNQVTE